MLQRSATPQAASRPGRWRAATIAVVVAVAALAVVTPAGAQTTAPPPSPSLSPSPSPDLAYGLSQLAELDAVAVILQDQLSAAETILGTRRAELAAAVAAADTTAATAEQARAAAEAVRAQEGSLAAAAYEGARTSGFSAVLLATSPDDLLEQMTGLALLAADGANRLATARDAVRTAGAAAEAATAARNAAADAEQTAAGDQTTLVARRSELREVTAQASALVMALSRDPRAAGSAQLAASRGLDAQRTVQAAAFGQSFFAVPTVGQLTSPFGPRGQEFHYGVDLANAIGTPIWAIADAVVISAGPASGFGLWVRLQHDDGTITVYGHIDTFSVQLGQRVSAGEQIARMGNRGESSGPHLHVEVVLPGGIRVDPRVWLAARGIFV